MVPLNLRWQASSQTTINTIEEKASGNPILPYILTQKKLGTPRKVIIENLMRQGYPYRSIKNAYILIEKMKETRLDWRSPTSINETARMIRRDIRARRVTYSQGMRILLGARDNLKTLITNPRDLRLNQMQREIKTTKNLLMTQYGDPRMMQRFQMFSTQSAARTVKA